jgi:hypothetical protein
MLVNHGPSTIVTDNVVPFVARVTTNAGKLYGREAGDDDRKNKRHAKRRGKWSVGGNGVSPNPPISNEPGVEAIKQSEPIG